jgi:mRNA-degrading endonuclease RelE of RelBE toxin-antitoxin system
VRRIDLLDLPDDIRDAVRDCAVQGTRTEFTRNGNTVAVLVSADEYQALRETIDIANDALLFAQLAQADEETPEQRGRYERLRFAPSAAPIYDAALRRIELDPIVGAPLFEPLKGLWSYRSGNLRIIYKIVPEARAVVVLSMTRVRRSS